MAPCGSEKSFSEYFDNDTEFLDALSTAVLPGDLAFDHNQTSQSIAISSRNGKRPRSPEDMQLVNKSSSHSSSFDSTIDVVKKAKTDDTYDASRFGQFGDYMRRKRAKLQIQNAQLDDENRGDGSSGSEKQGRIFQGLALYINGQTTPSVQELRTLIMEYGGIYHAYLDQKALVTHIITMSLTPSKIREFKHMKVVTPDWLVDSVAAETLLPWRDYIFRPGDRPEDTQGKSAPQKSLLDTFKSQPRPDSIKPSPRPKQSVVAASVQNKPETEDQPPTENPLVLDILHKSPNPPGKTSPTKQTLVRPRTPQSVHISDPVTPEVAAHVPGYAAHKSNPNAERAMRSAEWRAQNTSVAGADFIEGYYRNSRLHHLSAWKSELKALVAEAQEGAENGFGNEEIADDEQDEEGDLGIGRPIRACKDSERPERGHEDRDVDDQAQRGVSESNTTMRGAELFLRSPIKNKAKGKGKVVPEALSERVIMHVDFDSFFVAVGLITRPHLKDKPVVVCHSQGGTGGASSTSEIASASYAARKFGIKNGMSLRQARELCPSVQTMPYEFERYKQISLQFYTILMGRADDLQAVSVDEALIDVTSSVVRMKDSSTLMEVDVFSDVSSDPAKELAELIRSKVKRVTQCEVSIGISHNIMLARLATRRAKPASSYHLLMSELPSFIAPMHIDDLHGFGHATRDKAKEKLGSSCLGDLVGMTKGVLCDALGKGTGETLYNAMRGIDERTLESDKARKSVSCEINYGIRFENNEQAEKFVYQLAEEVARRLRSIDMRGRSLTLKIMKRAEQAPLEPPKFLGHGLCDVFNKQVTLSGGRATNDPQLIGADAWRLLKSHAFDPKELRGVRMQIQKLEAASSELSAAELGQSRLNFRTVDTYPKIGEASTSAKMIAGPVIIVDPPSQKDVALTEDRPKKTSTSLQSGLPSFSQVDKSVFDALPEDIRKELEQEYKNRSTSPTPTNTKSSIPFGNMQSPKVKISVPGSKSSLSRITRQLAPRNAPSISPKKNTLFAKREMTSISASDAELKKLKIDPLVFAALPPNLQREQLAGARFTKAFGSAELLVSGPRKIIKAHVRSSRSPSVPYRRIPNPTARFVKPPTLKQRGMRLYITETEDIQDSIQAWVQGSTESPPAHEDVDYFANFLLQCMDGAKSTDAGVEKVIAAMKWWIILLKRQWGQWECDSAPLSFKFEDDEDEMNSEFEAAAVGKAWWNAFREAKAKLDSALRKKFGGSLCIR